MNSKEMSQKTELRRIVHRTRGQGHGPIIRLMSPSDLGHLLKPFVFLDLIDADTSMAESMPIHPHSGIATVTLIIEGDVRFDDPESGRGTISYGGVEWMRAGGGVWHGKEMTSGTSKRVRGYQLWIALPPELENGPVDSQYLEADKIPGVGPARIILGSYAGVKSPVRSPEGINYLLVTLAPGERWEYHPPVGQDVAWLSVSRGAVATPDIASEGELVTFSSGNGVITMQADEKNGAVFIMGSSVRHPYELKLGYYSVHTSAEALQAGEARISEIEVRLREAGDRQATSGITPVFQ
ncbi:pirin family protein [uncultured Nostoc sp.]|uniref:pirin family protein n=1 Tax=uncultured Nostoc sp. TaxID=340711 RepID=UPI0035C9BB15